MKCPKCSGSLPTRLVLDSRSVTCPSCGSALRVRGWLWFVVAPTLLVYVFPLWWFDLASLTILAGLVVYLAVSYWICFLGFVRLELFPQNEE